MMPYRAVDVAEGHGHQKDHCHIHHQQQLTHRCPGQLQLDQAGDQIGASGGGSLGKNDAQGQTDHGPAADRRQHLIHGLIVDQGQHVHRGGGQDHGVQGAYQQMSADVLPAQDKQGDIQHKHKGADGDDGEIGVDNLTHASDPAKADEVGGIEPVKADGV